MSLFALARRLQMLPRRDYTWQWQDSDFRPQQPAGALGRSRAGVLRPSGIVDQGETGEVGGIFGYVLVKGRTARPAHALADCDAPGQVNLSTECRIVNVQGVGSDVVPCPAPCTRAARARADPALRVPSNACAQLLRAAAPKGPLPSDRLPCACFVPAQVDCQGASSRGLVNRSSS